MDYDKLEEPTVFTTPKSKENIIKVIGVGGGGNNAVTHMFNQKIENVSFVVCNTDRQALENSPVPTKLLIGSTGLGAGNIPEKAREAAEESAEQIAELFTDNTQMVFITAGMGGGTGTGAGPVVARIARQAGMLTVGIVTIPFLFEGRKKILKALQGAEEMSKHVDALMVINNERLTEIYPDLQFLNAFAKADDTLTIAARGISELITNNQHVINIDFNDVNTTLRDGGAAVISIGYGEGKNRVTNAINDALHSPLLKDRDILGSKKILFNIYFNPDAEEQFVMSEANELTTFITSIDPNVDVIWGVACDKSLGNKVKITLLAAGFDVNHDAAANPAPVRTETKQTPEPVAVQAPTTKPVVEAQVEESDKKKLEDIYGIGKTETIIRTSEAKKYVILTPDQITDDAVIEKFEKNPTHTRQPRVVDEIRKAGQKAEEPADPLQTDRPEDAPTRSGGTRIDFTN